MAVPKTTSPPQHLNIPDRAPHVDLSLLKISIAHRCDRVSTDRMRPEKTFPIQYPQPTPYRLNLAYGNSQFL